MSSDASSTSEALCAALMDGRETEAVKLLRKHPRAAAIPTAGRFPLHIAAFAGSTLLLSTLLDKRYKVDVNVTDEGGMTALLLTTMRGHLDACVTLLEHGARTDACTAHGMNALHLLCQLNVAKMKDSAFTKVLTLLSMPDTVNQVDVKGNTPLHYAVRRGVESVVFMLVSAGADARALNRAQESPLLLAAQEGYEAVVRILILAGADRASVSDEQRESMSQGIRELLACTTSRKRSSTAPARPLVVKPSKVSSVALPRLQLGGCVVPLPGNLQKRAQPPSDACADSTVLRGGHADSSVENPTSVLNSSSLMHSVDEEACTPPGSPTASSSETASSASLQARHRPQLSAQPSEAAFGAQLSAQTVRESKRWQLEFESPDSHSLIRRAASQPMLASSVQAAALLQSRLRLPSVDDLHNMAANNRSDLLQVAGSRSSESVLAILQQRGQAPQPGLAPRRGDVRQLHALIKQGQKSEMQKFLRKAGKEVLSQTDAMEHTALHIACRYHRREIALLLLDRWKVAPNPRDLLGFTPLLHAGKTGDLALVEVLLQRGADPTMTCKGASILHFLCECHVSDPLMFMRVIKLLLEHGASADLANKHKQTALHVAVEGANTQAVLILLNECKANFLLPDSEGNSPLQLAANLNHVELLPIFQRFGADLSRIDKEPLTETTKAALNKYISQVAQDTSQQVRVRSRSFQNPTKALDSSRHERALELALRPEVLQLFAAVETNNRPELLRIIRRETKDVLKRRNVGSQTVLHVAAENGYADLIEFLVDKYHINPNPTDTAGRTPLHIAATFGHLNVLDVLAVRAEVSISALTNVGESPIHCLARAHYENMNHLVEVLERFLQEGLSLNATTVNGDTPLHVAAQHQNSGFVLLLAKMGASIDEMNLFGETPLQLGARTGARSLVSLFLKLGASNRGPLLDIPEFGDSMGAEVIQVLRDHRPPMTREVALDTLNRLESLRDLLQVHQQSLAPPTQSDEPRKPSFALDLSNVPAAPTEPSPISAEEVAQRCSAHGSETSLASTLQPTLDHQTDLLVRKLFSVCGGGRDHVSMLDVGRLLNCSGHQVSDRELRKIFGRCDTHGRGVCSFREFSQTFGASLLFFGCGAIDLENVPPYQEESIAERPTYLAERLIPTHPRALSNLNALAQQTNEKALADCLFERMDRDRDGLLNLEDLRAVLGDCGFAEEDYARLVHSIRSATANTHGDDLHEGVCSEQPSSAPISQSEFNSFFRSHLTAYVESFHDLAKSNVEVNQARHRSVYGFWELDRAHQLARLLVVKHMHSIAKQSEESLAKCSDEIRTHLQHTKSDFQTQISTISHQTRANQVLRRVHYQQEKLKQLSERLSDPGSLTKAQLDALSSQIEALDTLLCQSQPC
mmetsp:Transcript_25649/g.64396  ORF Transcript_25649/g.64396 Transcript_25649/m.64396 type:complete len:1380 (-) Transcript_25649:3237-7376(-)